MPRTLAAHNNIIHVMFSIREPLSNNSNKIPTFTKIWHTVQFRNSMCLMHTTFVISYLWRAPIGRHLTIFEPKVLCQTVSGSGLLPFTSEYIQHTTVILYQCFYIDKHASGGLGVVVFTRPLSGVESISRNSVHLFICLSVCHHFLFFSFFRL